MTNVPRAIHQALPPSGPARELLRKKGQFWTPDWVALGMAAYALAGGSPDIFDPAVGRGAFLIAAKMLASESRRNLVLRGTELHSEALKEAMNSGLTPQDLAQVEVRDFLRNPPKHRYSAIVGNPPYIRHHRLDPNTKLFLKAFTTSLIGKPLDGRTGYHVFFLLRALTMLAPSGRLAFILPADTCEGVFAGQLWSWITARFRLDAVVTFTPDATPFPGVDTNAVIVLMRNAQPRPKFAWAECCHRSDALRRWMAAGLPEQDEPDIRAVKRNVKDALRGGLSRSPTLDRGDAIPLGAFAHVLRGIATGANEFFHLTEPEIARLALPRRYFVRAVGRTRDVEGCTIDEVDLSRLASRGRATFLLSIGDEKISVLPKSLRTYITEGEAKGLHRRPLVAARRPWYKMERRRPPEFLFAYLGRRNTRFIRNLAGVVPLTGFLCVYAKSSDSSEVEKLWQVLCGPGISEALRSVAKSYGGGAIKVEPRALERLPLRRQALEEVGIDTRLALGDQLLL